MGFFQLTFEYLEDGGLVSYPLVAIFLVITYSIGYRLAILFKGRKIHIRETFKNKKLAKGTIQFEYMKDLDRFTILNREEIEGCLEWIKIDYYQKIHRYSSVLNTAVLLAPLLGLLGTVIGMIETFSSLSNTDLFSSSGGIAGGISQALVTTQFGLIVAIPGVFLSRYLKKIEKKTCVDLEQIGELFLQQQKESL